jgi:haloalkane dehalogenase
VPHDLGRDPGEEASVKDDRSTGAAPSWLPRELFPFESRFVDVEGHSLHFVDEGSGPTLLLLHGNPTWCFLYRGVIQGLRHGLPCIALDYPGFGLSRAATGYDHRPASHARVVHAFVGALGLSGFTVTVQDWAVPPACGWRRRAARRFALSSSATRGTRGR